MDEAKAASGLLMLATSRRDARARHILELYRAGYTAIDLHRARFSSIEVSCMRRLEERVLQRRRETLRGDRCPHCNGRFALRFDGSIRKHMCVR